MNNVEQLSNFLQRVTSDVNLTTTHIGVCTALAVEWINNGFINPFNISRNRLMTAARIKSKTTYHKVINDLMSLNYLKYTPSYHPIKGSQVNIL
jgi:hypothetical protein